MRIKTFWNKPFFAITFFFILFSFISFQTWCASTGSLWHSCLWIHCPSCQRKWNTPTSLTLSTSLPGESSLQLHWLNNQFSLQYLLNNQFSGRPRQQTNDKAARFPLQSCVHQLDPMLRQIAAPDAALVVETAKWGFLIVPCYHGDSTVAKTTV